VLELLQKSGPMLGAEVQRKLGTAPSRHFRIIEVLRRRGLIVKLDYYTLALPGQSFDFGVRPISKRATDSIATGKDRILVALARFSPAATSTLATETDMSYVRTLRVLGAMQSEGTVRKDKDARWLRV
jgi:DNA-binding IclR family transcriptional regulator